MLIMFGAMLQVIYMYFSCSVHVNCLWEGMDMMCFTNFWFLIYTNYHITMYMYMYSTRQIQGIRLV